MLKASPRRRRETGERTANVIPTGAKTGSCGQLQGGDRTQVSPAQHGHLIAGSLPFHAALLLASLLPVVLLSKKLAAVLEYGPNRVGAPQALSGMVVAILIFCPEAMASVRAAWGNRLQRSVNLLFGAALSTIAPTVPAALLISLTTGKPIELGLSPVNQIRLAVTLVLCILTCTTGRTNVLNGLVHLVLFAGYFILMFGG